MINQLQFIRETIYNLKYDYGLPLEIYALISSATDLATGVKTITKTVYKIRQAILLPRKLDSEFIRIIGLHKRFDILDKEERLILIDASDYPKAYKPQGSDYILIHHQRFDILSVETYDHKLAVIIHAKKLAGEQPAAIINQSLSQDIGISQGVINE